MDVLVGRGQLLHFFVFLCMCIVYIFRFFVGIICTLYFVVFCIFVYLYICAFVDVHCVCIFVLVGMDQFGGRENSTEMP